MNWKPNREIIQDTNIGKMMCKQGFASYYDLWQWSVTDKRSFWEETIRSLGINLHQMYDAVFSDEGGVENTSWLEGGLLNIVDSCFQNTHDAIAITYQNPEQQIASITQKELQNLVNRIANSFKNFGVYRGDCIAIDLPMTPKCVALYLGAIKAGIKVATIADSFTCNEIAVRLNITQPKLVFTQDYLKRASKKIPLYTKVTEANPDRIVLITTEKYTNVNLRRQDVFWSDFLSNDTSFESIKQSPNDTITVLFSSGTTGNPKAIPWNHTTPIKSASDAYYHHNIQPDDVVCWPTNLGWMMGPWLIFATLINKATIALYGDTPLSREFGEFVQHTQVTMLGIVPSIVKHWKATRCMEGLNWDCVKCFSTTGEVSNPIDMQYLMQLAAHKPIIEYCGGTEIGGGYITSTMVQSNIPSTFSTKALGTDFVILDEDHKPAINGEVFLIPPIMGLSTELLNRDHHGVYYKNTPSHKNILRRHGDELLQLENGYFKVLGRVDDTMNLGGIKISATQIEFQLNQLLFIKECAAIAVPPSNGGPSKLVVFYVPSKIDIEEKGLLVQAQDTIKTTLNPLFKVSELIKIDILPRTASNKIMRRKLRDYYMN